MTSFQTTERIIRELVDRETAAWNTKDVRALLALFHPDFVWAWPPTADAHDPMEWIIGMGRFDEERWTAVYEELFETHDLIHNERTTVKVLPTPQLDGGIAVVDVDTLWRRKDTGADFHWKGRSCKTYTKLPSGEWRFISQTGLLDYSKI